MTLDAEAAADVERDAAHARLGQAQDGRRLAPHPMHHLRRGPDRHAFGARVELPDDAAAFHGNGGVAMMIEAALQAFGRAGERRRDIALPHREFADEIGGEMLVNDGAAGDRRRGIDHRRQGIEIDLGQFQRILGGGAAVGDDDGERLADMARLVMREQRLLRIEDLVLHQGAPFARQRKLSIGRRRQELQQIGAVQGVGDAGRGAHLGEIDRADARMRQGASDEGHMQHARQSEIGDELALPGQQALVLAPLEPAPDEGLG